MVICSGQARRENGDEGEREDRLVQSCRVQRPLPLHHYPLRRRRPNRRSFQPPPLRPPTSHPSQEALDPTPRDGLLAVDGRRRRLSSVAGPLEDFVLALRRPG